MGDNSTSNLTSLAVWNNMTSGPLHNQTDVAFTNRTSHYDVTTMTSLAVTQCLWNKTLNQTVCDVLAVTDGGNASNETDVVDMATSAHSLWLTMFLGILAAIISIVTVLGNLTVLLAFGLERSIRQPTNYFIASLAVSDLLIGTFSMPLFTQYLLLTYWPLGPWLCDLWLSLDWTVCLTSQYTVFFITMDRFLSVKIPAKYRNWRSERKVLVMVSITWVLPAIVFFTSIIGWQYFVGERTVAPRECEVQFMSTPLFTFLLTIGYYWITLIVMCVLYAGIYKVALDLQRKSDAKQRKLESTMELAADHSAIRNTASNSSDSQQPGANNFRKRLRPKKKAAKKEAAGSGKEQNNVSRKNVTTSFGGQNKLGPHDMGGHRDSLGGASMATDTGDNKDEDRSSSPAFASDDENSSSGAHQEEKKPKSSKANTTSTPNNARQGSKKASLNPKVGIAGIVNTALLTTPDSLRQTQNIVPGSHYADIGVTPALQRGAGGTPMPPSGQYLKPSHGGPHYSRLDQGHDSATEQDGGGQVEVDSLYSSSASDRLEKSTVGLIDQDITKGCIYIDEKSFLNLTNGDHVQPLLAITDGREQAGGDNDLDSPLWKRRSSLPLPPLASDVFDIVIADDDFSDTGITATTGLSGIKMNGEESGFNEEKAASQPSESVPSAPQPDQQDDDSRAGDETQSLSDPRRQRKCDPPAARLHSFVKSVRSRNSRRRNRRERKSKSENRARKALRTITIILGAFVLCWTPYHIMVFVIAMCGGSSCVNAGFYNFTYWLCYLNSPINPFCYAFANAQFKRTFLRILRFDWHRT